MHSGIHRRGILPGLMAALLLLLIANPVVSAAPARSDDDSDRHWWERPKVVQMLGISEEQISRIRKQTRGDVKKSAELKKTFRQERDNLDQLLAADELDEKGILKQTEKVLSTMAAFAKIETEIQFNAVKELTAKQRRELVKMKDSAVEAIRKKIQDRGESRSRE
ncbi:MAG: periplasmic heavy metal sensor [Syntrophaceae bacterium]|nr:periplasmic heavy metal sensor [Syntrophaceae bacterium]